MTLSDLYIRHVARKGTAGATAPPNCLLAPNLLTSFTTNVQYGSMLQVGLPTELFCSFCTLFLKWWLRPLFQWLVKYTYQS